MVARDRCSVVTGRGRVCALASTSPMLIPPSDVVAFGRRLDANIIFSFGRMGEERLDYERCESSSHGFGLCRKGVCKLVRSRLEPVSEQLCVEFAYSRRQGGQSILLSFAAEFAELENLLEKM